MKRALVVACLLVGACKADTPAASHDAAASPGASAKIASPEPTMPPPPPAPSPRPAPPDGPAPPRVRTLAAASPRTHLAVVLHGVGADADDLVPVARALAPALPGAEWLSPDGLQPFSGGGSGRQWFALADITDENRPARVRAAAEDVARWIDARLRERGLGWDKLVLVGFSQGSMVAHWLAVHRHPAAVIAYSGRFADDDPSARTTTPVLVVHGSSDAVIPVAAAAAARAALEARGARVTASIHPGLAHGIDERGLAEGRDFLARAVR